LVVGAHPNIQLLLGNPDGTFQSAVTKATGNGPSPFAAADMNADGRIDLVVVNGFGNSVSIFFSESPDRPTVLRQPEDATAEAGGNAAFEVECQGTSLIYQWRQNGDALADGNGISGVGTAILSLGQVSFLNSGSVFDCVVTNGCGSATSDTAVLTVTCDTDFNGSGLLSVQDIFDFLASYFAGEFRADFNGSMTLSVQDIFDFLAAYFAGCP
jgi:hypothetical protein